MSEELAEKKVGTSDTSRHPDKEASIQVDAAKKNNKKKPFETFEQFIEFAYKQNGRKITLNEKEEREIQKTDALPKDEKERSQKLAEKKERWQKLAEKDVLLAVPRQLLLACRNVNNSDIRFQIRCFVKTTLKDHMIFEGIDIESVLVIEQSYIEPSSITKIIKDVQEKNFSGTKKISKPLKQKEIETLKNNAAYTIAIWFANTGVLPKEELTETLFEAVWEPKAANIKDKDDSERFRLLTDITQTKEIGLACQVFSQKVKKQAAEIGPLRRKLEILERRAEKCDGEIENLRAELSKAHDEITLTREESDKTCLAMRENHKATVIHLRNDTEILRARFLRLLSRYGEQLNTGLAALDNPNPKIHVAIERMQRTSDAMSEEIKKLKEE